MVDVMNWIRGNLRVSSDKSSWAVGGYSQGATCALQFGAEYPNRFGTILAISSELGPTIGPSTVAKAFGGSKAAYAAVMPAAVMAREAPYADELAIFAVGQADTRYTHFAKVLQNAAEHAGIVTQLLVSPKTAHDWNTVRFALKSALPSVAARLGLG
jgi:S-formylglutathione hydrolase FrmB